MGGEGAGLRIWLLDLVDFAAMTAAGEHRSRMDGARAGLDPRRTSGREPPLHDPVLAAGDTVLTYRDLMVIGAATGALGRFVSDLRRGDHLVRSSASPVPGELVRSEAATFRRARHLESGDDLRTWLETRRLVLEDLEGYLRRLVARASRPSEPPAEPPGPVDALELYVELMCSGGWRSLASSVVDLVAARQLVDGGPGTSSPRDAGVDELLAVAGLEPHDADVRALVERARRDAGALDQLRQSVAKSPEAARRAGGHRAEWTTFEFELLVLASQAAAAEAVSCSRDGLSADVIATRAGEALRRIRARADELPAHLAGILEAAPAAEAVGPVEVEGGFAAVWLSERTRPSAHDAEVLRWATDEVLAEALERAVAGTVRELGPL